MDVQLKLCGESFARDSEKALQNVRKHGIRFDEAAGMFFDPLFIVVVASRNAEAANAAIGFDVSGRLLYVVHVEFEETSIRINSARRATAGKNMTILSDRIKARLRKDRPMTSITIRMPVDAIESMKAIAPIKGLIGYQSPLKSYVSEGLRRDEAEYLDNTEARLIEALKRRGVPDDVLEDATRELHPG